MTEIGSIMADERKAITEWAEKRRKRVTKLTRLLELTLKALEDVEIPWSDDWNPPAPALCVRLSTMWESVVNVSVRGLDLFSEGLEVYEALKDAGFEFTSPSDEPGLRRRTVYASLPDIDGRVWLCLYLKGEATCKIVSTGEMKPVEKFVCPGDADYPEPVEV